MRLSGSRKFVWQIGAVCSAVAAAASHINAQVQTTLPAGSITKTVTYTAVLPTQQPPQNPNAQASPPPQQPAPPSKPKYDIYIGPDAGVYLPTSAKTRSRFGSDWFSYGVGIFPISSAHSGGRFSPSIQLLSQSNGDDSLFFGLIGVQYRQALIPGQGKRPAKPTPKPQPGQPQPDQPKSEQPRTRDFIPYFGLSAYEAVGDLVAVEDNVHSGVRTGVAGAAFIGVNYRNRAYIEMRYLQTSVLKSFDLSGFSLDIGYRFRISGN